MVKSGVATIKDIARSASLTPAAVSMILNGKGKFKESTVKTVQRIARDLRYVANASASGLVKRQTRLIGFLVPSMAEPFTVEILRGLEERLHHFGYDLVLYNTIGNEDHLETLYQRIAGARRVDGIVVQMFSHTERQMKAYMSHLLPCVLIEGEAASIDSITVDNYAGAFAATEYLIRKNRKRILFICGELLTNVMIDRKRGFLDAMKKHAIRTPKSLMFEINYENSRMRQKGMEIIEHFDLTKPLPFDAAFCAAGDEVAAGMIRDLLDHRYRVPQDVAVVGFDDQPIAQIVSPSLTTVRQPIREMGATAINFIINRLQSAAIKPQHKVFKAELIIRDST
ncbi:MAG: LacI family DNA-binding transcriptional regulator [Rhizobacter sp.]|nr:LacI family DNA-binding transcriptional regulator [Chlorobiales bacterium]